MGAGHSGGDDAPSNRRCCDPLVVDTSDWRTGRTGSDPLAAPFPLLGALAGDAAGPFPVPPFSLVTVAIVVVAGVGAVSVTIFGGGGTVSADAAAAEPPIPFPGALVD